MLDSDPVVCERESEIKLDSHRMSNVIKLTEIEPFGLDAAT